MWGVLLLEMNREAVILISFCHATEIIQQITQFCSVKTDI
jgi:hypothetical protein